MTGRVIWYFVKVFTEEAHADQFIKGNLLLRRLSCFKNVESESDDGRSDTTEAVSMWWQPDDIVMDLSVPALGLHIKITKADLAGPVSFQSNDFDNSHVLCLYTIYTDKFISADGETKFVGINGSTNLTETDVAELRKQLVIDDRYFEFGKFAVIVRAVPFLERLKAALRNNGQWFRGKLVEYYDDETFHGEIEPREIPFRKQKRFSYQREFRVCVQTNTEGEAPLSIEIGDISDICGKTESSQLNSVFSLSLKLNPSSPD